MLYKSTRGAKDMKASSQAIIQGMAADGGLFVPETLPQVDLAFVESLVKMSYEERAYAILHLFLSDYDEKELMDCVERAYGNGKFDTEKRAPVKMLDKAQVLELWHGPTSAFKDMALQLLPQLLSTALPKNNVKEDILILVATSGDTGKAALEGFKDVPQTKIMVFYPNGGVSHIQQLQMQTQEGGNVSVMAVKGNFDDAQSGVKEIFGDKEFAAKLAAEGVSLSSANSINWGRLAPQIVYYFSAYADMLAAGRVKLGEKINFCVPTGNFGDILAGFYAREMGLPVNKLICASNSNNVLTDFLQTGTYNRQRPFYKTITPSMDILISSNLERLLYHMTDGNTAQVADWMQQLAENGNYEVGKEILEKIQQVFWADWSSDVETKVTIGKVYHKHHYVLDTHSAVAWNVAEKYQQRHAGDKCPLVIVSTASPYKFNDSVLDALDVDRMGLDDFQLLRELQEMNDDPIPQGLARLEKLPVVHEGSCERQEMREMVFKFAVK